MYHIYFQLSMDDLRFSGDFSSDFSVSHKNSGCRTIRAAAFFDNNDDLPDSYCQTTAQDPPITPFPVVFSCVFDFPVLE